MASGAYDALVTTDGDADRPLMADGAGRIVRGDILGLITARHLGVTRWWCRSRPARPWSAPAASAGRADEGRLALRHRRHGGARADGATPVAGFEANGGFLLGSDVVVGHGRLAALPTRDAMLPILATLAAMRASGGTLAELVTSLDAGEMASDRLPNTPSELSGAFWPGSTTRPSGRTSSARSAPPRRSTAGRRADRAGRRADDPFPRLGQRAGAALLRRGALGRRRAGAGALGAGGGQGCDGRTFRGLIANAARSGRRASP